MDKFHRDFDNCSQRPLFRQFAVYRLRYGGERRTSSRRGVWCQTALADFAASGTVATRALAADFVVTPDRRSVCPVTVHGQSPFHRRTVTRTRRGQFL
jgi:hypothetical protein